MIWALRLAGLALTGLLAAVLFIPFGITTTAGDTPTERKISVPARPLEVVCPGSLYQLGGADGTDIDSLESLGDADFYLIENGEPTPYRADKPALFVAEGNGQSSSVLSGYQWQQLSESRIAGLVSLSCKKPVTETWMLGGRTNLGSESLLIIHNPDVLSTILDMKFFDGETEESDSVSLAPDETKVVNLARYVSTDEAVGLNITSQGGRFAAWIQSKTNSGITPTGADIEAHNQLQKNPSMIISALSEDLPAEFRIPQIHALVPSASTATVSISSLQGGLGDAFRVNLSEGVNSIEIPDLSPGSYRITVEVEQGLLSSRTVNPLIPDYSLTQSEAPISGEVQMVAVLDGQIEVASVEESVVTLRITRAGVREAAVIGFASGREMISADVQAGDLVEIEGEGLLIRIIGQGAEYLPADNSNIGSDLSITVR